MRIRRARDADRASVEALLDEMDRAQAGWRVFRPRAEARAQLLARFRAAAEDPDSVHLVAEEGGRVVGMALATVHRPSSVSDERSVEISSFVVGAAHRRRGIGTALARAVADFARARGVRHLDLRVFAANRGALRFWRRVGFRPRMVQMVADPAEVGRPGGPAPGGPSAGPGVWRNP